MSERSSTALVLYESMFDNTAFVADAVARGLGRAGYAVHCLPVSSLAATGPVDVDLIVLGAPTHAFSLSRPQTRADAVRQGAAPDRARIGAREWIAAVRPESFGTDRVAVFDTRVAKVRRLPLAAGATAGRLLRRRGFRLLRKPVAFLVEDTRGPLVAGELARAERWGQMVGAACRDEMRDAA
ncbi:flavodoxin family protein [Nocardioides sp. SYSU DS0651]|uniref:flavodoxin family protein n=1 Tax=Nocardioides sp. SYSU DS0651 TaxID=3415955 RepID=UPI003F4BE646